MQARRLPLDNLVRERLANGLTVLIREDHSIPVVTSMIWYKVGPRLEPEGSRGISHFLEHLLFKGTDRYAKGEIDDLTTRNGGANNAFTSNDFTAYYFSFAADRWLLALDIEASRMRDTIFDSKEFEAEKKVVIEELKMELDHPWGALHQQVERLSFDRHPYRYPIIGLVDDLLAMTSQQVADFYRIFYAPNNAVMVLVGALDAPRALDEVRRRFEAIPSQRLVVPTVHPERPREGPRRIQIERPARVSRLHMAYPCPAAVHPDFVAVQLLDKILSEGKLSRLYRLVEKHEAVSSAASEINETYHPSLLHLRFEFRPDQDAAAIESLILAELDDLRRRPPSSDELSRAQNQLSTAVWHDFESTLDQATQLGLMETLSSADDWQDFLDRVGHIDAEQIQEAAGAYLDLEQRVVGLCSGHVPEDADGL